MQQELGDLRQDVTGLRGVDHDFSRKACLQFFEDGLWGVQPTIHIKNDALCHIFRQNDPLDNSLHYSFVHLPDEQLKTR